MMPGWDSIESTTRLHNFFEFWGIALFLVVVGFEFLAYFYGHRRDWLIDDAARVAGIAQQKADKATEERHAEETARIRQQLTDAQREAREAKARADATAAQQAQRHLTDGQKTALIELLKPFAGQKVIARSMIGNDESKAYRDDWLDVFKAANWDYLSEYGESAFIVDPIGITIYLHPHAAGEGSTKAGGAALIKALETLKLFDGGEILQSTEVADDQIMIAFGKKERPAAAGK